jgi:hypothetical protein
MDVGAIIAGGVVLAAMIGISAYAAVTLPAGARIPVHHGLGGYNNWVSKNTALILWPAGGAVAFAVLVATAASAGTSGKAAPVLILPVVLLIAAVSQYGAIRAAMARSNGGDLPSPGRPA